MGVKISHHTKGRTRFRVSENRMLRRISGPKGKKWQEGEEDCIMRGFIICTLCQILLGLSEQEG